MQASCGGAHAWAAVSVVKRAALSRPGGGGEVVDLQLQAVVGAALAQAPDGVDPIAPLHRRRALTEGDRAPVPLAGAQAQAQVVAVGADPLRFAEALLSDVRSREETALPSEAGFRAQDLALEAQETARRLR